VIDIDEARAGELAEQLGEKGLALDERGMPLTCRR
jgi:hypothetical protein